MHGGIEAVDGFDTFAVCCGFALEGLAVPCPGENASLFEDACVTKAEPSERKNFIDSVLEKLESEGV